VFKQTKELKAKQKSSGWGFGFFSSKEETTQDQTEFMKELEKEMSQRFEEEKALGGGEAALKMADLPKVQLNFKLDDFRVKLLDEESNGIQNYSNQFIVRISLFDTDNKYCKHSKQI
jgi:hypothetical protein